MRLHPDTLVEVALDGVFIACGVHKSHTRAYPWGRGADSHIPSGGAGHLVCVDCQSRVAQVPAKMVSQHLHPLHRWQKVGTNCPTDSSLFITFTAQHGGCSINKVSPLLILKQAMTAWVKMANVFKKTKLTLPLKTTGVCTILSRV